MLRERQVEECRPRRQRLARHEADDAVLGVEPDRRHVAVARHRADHGDRTPADAHDVAHVVAHPERTPLGQQVGGASPEGHEQVGASVPAREGRCLVDLSVGPADEEPVSDGEPDLPLALDGLLQTLAPGQFEEHPLLARRLGVAPIGLVEREVLDDDQVGHVDVREPGDERLDRRLGVLRRAARGVDAERGEEEQEDGGASHVIWL